MNCYNEQEVSYEPSHPTMKMPESFPISPKASEYLYGSKGFISRTTPDVLNNLLSRTSPSLSIRSAFLHDCERRRKSKGVSFETETEKVEKRKEEEIDYGYDVDFGPPPPKKMRMERRNSKTPRMLMAMNASLASLDFLNDNDDSLFQTNTTEDDDGFDGGLQIAEDLVKQLQSRRRRTALNTSCANF